MRTPDPKHEITGGVLRGLTSRLDDMGTRTMRRTADGLRLALEVYEAEIARREANPGVLREPATQTFKLEDGEASFLQDVAEKLGMDTMLTPDGDGMALLRVSTQTKAHLDQFNIAHEMYHAGMTN